MKYCSKCDALTNRKVFDCPRCGGMLRTYRLDYKKRYLQKLLNEVGVGSPLATDIKKELDQLDLKRS
jgi:uncharacterized C2H2 Zn-finger protein